ncbi:cytidine deaminase [Paenibacillus sp. UMB4589-SE434]|uniref:cytidine deaminase n=1 Tax=Paenibacillus sp. UMB4589-SE434 TaxID=3046314 RepID=UPI00254F5101|nr:cytidine deaminase [Paenibacillus sp. UMB4589-SE434]MDK8180984.1 cytidine deaminase [Paenibacillus sp. UMB4589-SE434]
MNATQLMEQAKLAREKAYTPYSHFKVGAALLDADGHVHLGCNVENAAYGPTNCAERTALFRAIADGCEPRSFKAIAVVGDTSDPITPCGVCRQVILELCPSDMPVYMGNLNGEVTTTTVGALLPGAFDVNSLESSATRQAELKE